VSGVIIMARVPQIPNRLSMRSVAQRYFSSFCCIAGVFRPAERKTLINSPYAGMVPVGGLEGRRPSNSFSFPLGVAAQPPHPAGKGDLGEASPPQTASLRKVSILVFIRNKSGGVWGLGTLWVSPEIITLVGRRGGNAATPPHNKEIARDEVLRAPNVATALLQSQYILRSATCAVIAILLDIGRCAGIDQLGLGRIGLFLADAFLDRLRRGLDQILGLLEP